MTSTTPIGLLPDNSRYFLFKGVPTVLVTSGEHYGAVLNAGFDYDTYLRALAADGLNHTRTFSGVYREEPGAFGIVANNLAPKAQDYVSPWARVGAATGHAKDGLAKFDLDAWNLVYFERLHSFMAKAEELGIVVEFTLFCPFYAKWNGNLMWDVCPMNIANNINGVGDVTPFVFHTMGDPSVQKYQEALTVKLVEELNGYDNILFEICNEPWNDGITLEWQHRIAEVIARTEDNLGKRHLISRNVCNGYQKVLHDHPAVDIYQFHYTNPPIAPKLNRDLKKPIGLNETGFAGKDDFTYRYQAWEFMMAGGALYNNLDYSFVVGSEDGTHTPEDATPGGGSTALRRQLGYLRTFLEDIRVWQLTPDTSFILGVEAAHATTEAVSDPGNTYAIYVRAHFELFLDLDLPEGTWRLQWHSPEKCGMLKEETVCHKGGAITLFIEDFGRDIALVVNKV